MKLFSLHRWRIPGHPHSNHGKETSGNMTALELSRPGVDHQLWIYVSRSTASLQAIVVCWRVCFPTVQHGEMCPNHAVLLLYYGHARHLFYLERDLELGLKKLLRFHKFNNGFSLPEF